MAAIRPESEVDRTAAALAADHLELPLTRGTVEVHVAPNVTSTSGGQRLVALLVNVLARMKGVVTALHLITNDDPRVLPGTPLKRELLNDGLIHLVHSLNTPTSPLRATLNFGPAHDPVVRVRVGDSPAAADLVVASDAWRALLGKYADNADWHAACPAGPALAAVIASVEVFKRIVNANSGARSARLAPDDFSYSAFNHGTGDHAAAGPDVHELRLADTAIVGCGAGGSGTAFVLATHPRITGSTALVEPGKHKPSNLNRYLATTAEDVQGARHKLASLVDHLAHCAPTLALDLHAVPWEQLESHPWGTIVSAVDTIEARWQIQRRVADTATIIDLAVDNLLYSVLRVTSGSRCLFCKHPFDADLGIKQRALRWGVSLDTIRDWTATNAPVDEAMLRTLATTQGRDQTAFQELLGVPFTETPALLECGATSLRADVPSQAPVLPLATSAAAVIGAAELIKRIADMSPLDNWLAHDLRRSPTDPWTKHRNPLRDCPHHDRGPR